jgi:hypothetical protein
MDRSGAVITAAFALAWALSATTGMTDRTAALGAAVLAATVTVVAVVAALRPAAARHPARATGLRLPGDWQRRFNLIGAVQGASIALVVLLALVAGLVGLVPAAVCIVVGLHFFPLADAVGMRYRPLGLVLCLVGAVGVLVFATVGLAASVVVVGAGAALALWGTSFQHTFSGLQTGADPDVGAASAS